MNLTNKTILVLSPQNWGKMWVSKHHYANELARLGNKVFFLNPPGNKLGDTIKITKQPNNQNLFVIDHDLFFPYNLKFHATKIFHLLMKYQISKIQKVTGKIDIVWSFDIGNLYPFKYFEKSAFKIFHPVDEPLNIAAINSAKDADILFSVTSEIIDKYKNLNIPSYFINHGISDSFLNVKSFPSSDTRINIGFSGNLLRDDIDRNTLLKIVSTHKEYIFNFWGSYHAVQSNIAGAEDNETRAFIRRLQKNENVRLHGVISSELLPALYQQMDAFLICYDVQKDQSKGTNYHKVMEFISTGKVIISNNITTYKDFPELVSMINERETNDSLPALFSRITANLTIHNTAELMRRRKEFALQNSYSKQIERIEKIINKLSH